MTPATTQTNEAGLSFWTQKLAGTPPALDFPCARPRGAAQAWRPERRARILPPATVRALGDLARREGVAQSELFLLGFQALLLRTTGQADLLVGLFDERGSTLPLRVDLSGDPSVCEALRRTHTALAEARARSETSLERLLAHARVPATALFQAAFGTPRGDWRLAESCRGMDFTWAVSETESGALATIEFNAELYDEILVARMHGHYATILAGMAGAPDARLGKLPFLTAEERRQILIEWNAKVMEFPRDATLHGLFEERARARPKAVAASFRGASLTYAELEARANQVAHHLRSLGIGPNRLVGISCERSFEMLIGLVAIAKAGGAYVPMDPSYPAERLAFMIEDSGVGVLLTQAELVPRVPPSRARVIALDAERFDHLPASDPRSGATATDLSYVIYTSGTTGKPKGVVLNHRGRVNNFLDFNRRYGVGEGDALIALASLSFDMCAYDVFGILAAGATIVLPEPESMHEPSHQARLMSERCVTIWHTAPAMLKMLVDWLEEHPREAPRALRLVLLGGDWIPVTLPDRLRALVPHCRVISMGGATECSMDSTIYEVLATDPRWKSIPYGEPMTNQTAYVLDVNLEPLPIGAPGELYLGGIGVAEGYHQRPELTAERFLPCPFVPGERMYETGDLARWGADGNLELLGRMDNQVKIRGFRIELGEIEARLRKHPWVREGVVVARPDATGERRLVAYVVLSSDGRAGDDSGTSTGAGRARRLGPELRRHLAIELPDYMVPAVYVAMDALPLSPNRKVDRKALPEPDPTRPEMESAYVAPRDAIEAVLARVWTEAFGLDRVGVDDAFLELGGHSLVAVRIQARLAEILPFDVAVPDIFETATIARLATRLTELGDRRSVDVRAVCGVVQEVARLSDAEVAARLDDTKTARGATP
jgi:amino acid adenylation domain-containing protein